MKNKSIKHKYELNKKMLGPILRKFIYSCSQMWLTKQFNTDVDVEK